MWTAPAIAALIGLFLGLLLLVSGLGTVINPAARVQAMREFSRSAGLQYLGGVIAFLLGAAIVVMVPLSDDLFSICVTILGWATLLKGVLLLLWSDGMQELAARLGEGAMPVIGWATTIIGAVLFIAAMSSLRSEGDLAEAQLLPPAQQSGEVPPE